MSLISCVQATSIRERSQAADYAELALRAIVQVPHAKDPPELLDRLMRATEVIGASASVYTASIPEDGSDPSCFSLFACDPQFAQEQANRGALLDNPWFRFARTHTMPGTDHQMPLQHSTDAEAVELARQFGFRSCLVVPTVTGSDPVRLEMLCLGSTREDDFEGSEARVVRTLARSLAAELHDWLTHHLRRQLRTAARLQEADLRLLAMERQGMGTKEIAIRTGLSLASVDCRFGRINARLKCPSRQASARRAAAYGLLDPT